MPELSSTNEKFIFEMRMRLIDSKKKLTESDIKMLFTEKKYFRNDIFMRGIKNHVLEFNHFKNHMLLKLFGYESKKGFSIINAMVILLFYF